MKKSMLILATAFLGITACEKNHIGCEPPPSAESACIQAKITAMQTANKDYTSVKRYFKNNDYFWLFDTGSAFDAPQYLLNTACDTVCTWSFRANEPCQLGLNLGDSTAVVIWKK
jgi:hypothetical protein